MAAANSTGSVGLGSLGLSRGLSGLGLASGIGLTACAAVGVCCCWPASSARGTRIGATSVAMLLGFEEHKSVPRAHRRGKGTRPDSLRQTHPPTHRQQQRSRESVAGMLGSLLAAAGAHITPKSTPACHWGLQQPDPAAGLAERPQGGRFSRADRPRSNRLHNRAPALRITS
jgi:hypothetical protein